VVTVTTRPEVASRRSVLAATGRQPDRAAEPLTGERATHTEDDGFLMVDLVDVVDHLWGYFSRG
jgi:hypothetical protein